MSEQPYALRLADLISDQWHEIEPYDAVLIDQELRRLHEVNQELVEALEDIADMYDYEASCGDLASRLYEAKCLALAAIVKARGEG